MLSCLINTLHTARKILYRTLVLSRILWPECRELNSLVLYNNSRSSPWKRFAYSIGNVNDNGKPSVIFGSPRKTYFWGVGAQIYLRSCYACKSALLPIGSRPKMTPLIPTLGLEGGRSGNSRRRQCSQRMTTLRGTGPVSAVRWLASPMVCGCSDGSCLLRSGILDRMPPCHPFRKGTRTTGFWSGNA